MGTSEAADREARRESFRRRAWSVRLATIAAIAVTIGVSPAQVQASARERNGISALALAHGVDPARVRAAAHAAADPIIDEARSSGSLTARQHAGLRRSVARAASRF